MWKRTLKKGSLCVSCETTVSPKLVELPGIEPGSYAVLWGLLRAQWTASLLGSPDHAHESGRWTQLLFGVPL